MQFFGGFASKVRIKGPIVYDFLEMLCSLMVHILQGNISSYYLIAQPPFMSGQILSLQYFSIFWALFHTLCTSFLRLCLPFHIFCPFLVFAIVFISTMLLICSRIFVVRQRNHLFVIREQNGDEQLFIQFNNFGSKLLDFFLKNQLIF